LLLRCDRRPLAITAPEPRPSIGTECTACSAVALLSFGPNAYCDINGLSVVPVHGFPTPEPREDNWNPPPGLDAWIGDNAGIGFAPMARFGPIRLQPKPPDVVRWFPIVV